MRYVKVVRIDDKFWVYNGDIENYLPNGRGSLLCNDDNDYDYDKYILGNGNKEC